ncbi:MAG: hypothetical protein JXN63_06815 [Candidatus Delongbacteria bacterium]|nr:hypothetical protein [Candidatus Delongbacteria bacterium]
MAKTITIRSVSRKMTYSVTGVCEICSAKYSIDNTVDVGASTAQKVITDRMLVNTSKGRAEMTYWDVLQNVFIEPRRLKVYKKCSSCGHVQSWMRLSKEKAGFFTGLFEGGRKNGSAGYVPNAPVFSISDYFDVSIHDYPSEIPFGMRAMEQACLFTCVKRGVPLHYVKYLGAKVYSDKNYSISGSEFNAIRQEIEYRGTSSDRKELNTNILKGRNTFFPFCIRMNARNWKNLARSVEDYHYKHISEENVMKLILTPGEGGISDDDLENREKMERFLEVDRSKKI